MAVGVGVALGLIDAVGATEGEALIKLAGDKLGVGVALAVVIVTFLLKVNFTSLVLKVIGSLK